MREGNEPLQKADQHRFQPGAGGPWTRKIRSRTRKPPANRPRGPAGSGASPCVKRRITKAAAAMAITSRPGTLLLWIFDRRAMAGRAPRKERKRRIPPGKPEFLKHLQLQLKPALALRHQRVSRIRERSFIRG